MEDTPSHSTVCYRIEPGFYWDHPLRSEIENPSQQNFTTKPVACVREWAVSSSSSFRCESSSYNNKTLWLLWSLPNNHQRLHIFQSHARLFSIGSRDLSSWIHPGNKQKQQWRQCREKRTATTSKQRKFFSFWKLCIFVCYVSALVFRHLTYRCNKKQKWWTL